MLWKVLNKCFFVSFVLGFAACQTENPAEPSPFEKAYVELMIVSQVYSASVPDARNARKFVLKKYNFTIKSFDSTFTILQNNPEKWFDFQRNASAYADTLSANWVSLMKDFP